jgi:carbonic anhydrase
MRKWIGSLLIAIPACLTVNGQSQDPVKYTHNRADKVKGPYVWGAIKGYEACGVGNPPTALGQSPIDIVSRLVKPGPERDKPSFQYDLIPPTVNNTGHTIQVPAAGLGSVDGLGGAPFRLTEFHLHADAEHTVNGDPPVAMEIHVVHERRQGDRLERVVGAIRFVQTEEPTEILDRIIDKALGRPVVDKPIDLKSFFPPGEMYLSYQGSLTTPPCDANVRFLLAGKTQKVSRHAVEGMHTLIKAFPGYKDFDRNNRPLQVGRREVFRIGPSPK